MKCNIVIANYNYSKWIEGCVKSALSQTYKDTVISVVDDCSTDNSVDIAIKTLGLDKANVIETDTYLAWMNEDNTRQVFRLKNNSGPSTARNTAIAYNIDTCDFFAPLDADDEISPTKIEVLVGELKKFPNVGCIYADYMILDINTNKLAYEFKRTYSFEKLMNECIVHSGCVLTKEALKSTLENTGYYDVRIKGPEDYDLWLRISEKFMILHYPEILTTVRSTGQNISNTNLPQNSENYRKGFEILNAKLYARRNGTVS